MQILKRAARRTIVVLISHRLFDVLVAVVVAYFKSP